MALMERQTEDADIQRTVKLLGGRNMLRRSVRNRLEAHDLLQKGLPGHALEHLIENVVFLAADHASLEKAVGISWRTYQRRKDAPERPLSPEQSGRAWKFAEILGRAIELFGSKGAAEVWLESPALGLERRLPIDLLSTPAGVETLEDHLTRLEYGVYA